MFTKTGKEENYTNWWIDRQKVCRDETIVIENIPLFVAQGVFSPKIENTNSVGLLLRTFPDVRGKRVLEIGTGTGVLAIQAARSGAKEVIATDIIPVAIENAAKNFKSTNTDKVISLINEDRFENLSGRFDIIIMNIILVLRIWPQKKKSKWSLYRYIKD